MPVAIVALALNVAVIWFVYGKELRKPFPKLEATLPPAVTRSAVWKGGLVSVVVVVAFALGAPPPLAAILGGSAMLLSRATDPKLLYARIDWTLLALFVGLFVVVAGLDESGVSMKLRNALAVLRVDTVFGMTVLAGILSNVVSNVPAVMVLKSSVLALPPPSHRVAHTRHGLHPERQPDAPRLPGDDHRSSSEPASEPTSRSSTS